MRLKAWSCGFLRRSVHLRLHRRRSYFAQFLGVVAGDKNPGDWLAGYWEFELPVGIFRGLNSNLRLVSYTPNRTAQLGSREKILEYSRKRCPEAFSVVGFAQ